ncbi:hypothetical protein MUN88_18570 [Gracilibacillus caseinilyticus]|uniref:DUF6884 domain-containing protein n=1 Tax=Gracilibacillus caseinilyticus TaxID=2932256 RepID=A0ABY4EUS7_9BACI|nr:DUF6884 domain-containing protein [Gracilibacillus caseinilyticus]UOQ48034.1 hypothetical protein MUN88_18570 [Gracilibacillus caseinilyticus]
MAQLFIIPCGKKKIWDREPDIGAVEAKNAYIGVLHQLCRQYVDCFGGDWVIISGKHGMLLPSDVVPGNYDLTFRKNDPNVVTVSTLQRQVKQKQLQSFNEIIALTGKKYRPFLEEVFDEVDRIQYPLNGATGIGHIQKWLKDSIATGKPLHDLHDQ